jgi:nucleoside-diphosphate-sugar epimerase
MKIAIWGAAGAIGHAVAAELDRRSLPYRVVGRDAAKLARFAAGEKVVADVADRAGCERAAQGADAIVYTLGLPYSTEAFAAYPPMMRLAVDAARAAGAAKMVLISNVYPYGRPRTATVTEEHPREPASVKGRYRKEQEDILLGAHERGRLATLSLRLPDFYGPHADLAFGTEIAKAAVAGKTANLLGDVDAPHQFCFTPDVGPIVCDLLARDDVFGAAYNFAGSGTISQRGFAEKCYAAAGKRTRFRAAGKGLLRVAGLFSPLLRELVEMAYLTLTPVILADARLQSLLPGLVHTGYDEGIRKTIEHLR